ncbi:MULTISPECIES: DUF305 domain-containing protein [Hymenobacteraceae]|uniref:DUF305 domain-containing protein n=1 Tax=Nibribacter koreensis TaxID=1084519 RepID=A0ABP8G461_9BACT|nr:DUF305 domain-containing protein [Rufibacter sp. DG15C]AMM50733.1 hypothetical protein TH61_05445 [Rufibacter sp. DG15C]
MKINLLNNKCAVLAFGISLSLFACSGNTEKAESTSAAQTEEHSGSGHGMPASGSNRMMDLMHGNMAAMQKMEMTGDLDHDFARMMAIHHAGALSMAQEQADNGQDTMLVNMARKTLASQKEEQDKLHKFVDSHKPVSGDKAGSMRLLGSMESSMAGMEHAKGGTTDHDFAALMGIHHQSGIDMAKAYLPGAKSPELRAMAQKIIVDQQREKQQMDTWLEENKQ